METPAPARKADQLSQLEAITVGIMYLRKVRHEDPNRKLTPEEVEVTGALSYLAGRERLAYWAQNGDSEEQRQQFAGWLAEDIRKFEQTGKAALQSWLDQGRFPEEWFSIPLEIIAAIDEAERIERFRPLIEPKYIELETEASVVNRVFRIVGLQAFPWYLPNPIDNKGVS